MSGALNGGLEVFPKYKIVQVGDKVLRQKSLSLSAEEVRSPAVQHLIEMMRETMRDAPGVGLAAPQIGLPIQLAMFEDREEFLKDIPAEVLEARKRRGVPFQVIINPVITLGSESVEFFEGCLSMPGFTALVPRALTVTVEALNERAERVVIRAEGWHARILQHEIDHLNGIVYVDRMRSRSLATLDNMNRFWKNLPIEEICAELGIETGGTPA